MKKLKELLAIMLLLAACFSFSCSKEETADSSTDQLIGIWELDDLIVSDNANEPYLESVLMEKLIEGQGVRPYVFDDTIQFHKEGYFLESHEILRNGETPHEWRGRYSVNGRKLTFTQPLLSSTWYDRVPLFDCEDDLLVLYITFPESALEVIKQHLEWEGHPVEQLEIEKISYTQIYKKVKKFPSDVN